jgi:uncharacterized protein YjbI with pentapeptide repeats
MKTTSYILFFCLISLAVAAKRTSISPNIIYIRQEGKAVFADLSANHNPYSLTPYSLVNYCSFYNGANQLNTHDSGSIFYYGFKSLGVTFRNKADFRKTTFKQITDFTNSIFADTADFTNADFETEASFDSVTFSKTCHFVLARINDEIDFTNATFGRIGFFYGLQFDAQMKGGLTFTNAILPDTIDFSDNPFLLRQIEFTDANFNDSISINEGEKKARLHYIYLDRTDISKIRIDYTHFRLCLTSPHDVHKKLSNEEIATCYEGLLRSFKEHNQTDSYNALDIEYKNWQSKNNFWTWINGLWWQYGYEKGRVLLWTIGFLIFFSLINVCLYDALLDTYEIESLRSAKKIYVFSQNPFIKGLQAYKFSFIYTTLIFSKLGIDFNKIQVKVNNWLALSLIAIEYLIGLLCTGCLINWVVSK